MKCSCPTCGHTVDCPACLARLVAPEARETVVKWFNAEKGYGWLYDPECGLDWFVHFSYIQTDGYRTLSADQRVAFVGVEGERGRQAVKVWPL